MDSRIDKEILVGSWKKNGNRKRSGKGRLTERSERERMSQEYLSRQFHQYLLTKEAEKRFELTDYLLSISCKNLQSL